MTLAVCVGIWLNSSINGFFDGFTDSESSSAEESQQEIPAWIEFISMGSPVVFYMFIVLVGALVVTAWSAYVWWFERYQITHTHVRLRTGLVFRRDRQTRLDRVHALDLQRPVVTRLLGLAELRFEVADAGETSVVLRYLKYQHARQLRQELLGAAGAVSHAAASDTGEQQGSETDWQGVGEEGAGAREQMLLRLPVRRVICARLLTVSFLLSCVLVVSGVVLAILFPQLIGFLVAFFGPMLLTFVGMGFKALDESWGFTMARNDHGLRLRYGLLNKVSQTVPTHRVQAVGVYRPLLWRWAGWSMARANVAGYGGSGDSLSSTVSRSVLLPVATDDELRQLFTGGLAVPGGDELTDVVLDGLTGEADQHSRFHHAPSRARWVAPLVRRRYGYAVTDHAVITRRGRLYRQCAVMNHGKVQSVGIKRGPLLRLLKLSDVQLHSTAGAVRAVAARMDQRDAEGLVVQQLQRLQSAVVLVAEPASDGGELPQSHISKPPAPL